jgi:hypothetical protein
MQPRARTPSAFVNARQEWLTKLMRLEHEADSIETASCSAFCLSIAFAENRFPPFGAML